MTSLLSPPNQNQPQPQQPQQEPFIATSPVEPASTSSSSSSSSWIPSWSTSSSSSTTATTPQDSLMSQTHPSSLSSATKTESQTSSSSSWFSFSSSPWSKATDSFHYAAEATYASISEVVSGLYSPHDANDYGEDIHRGGGVRGGMGHRSLSSSGNSWGSQDSPELAFGGTTMADSPSSLILSLQRQQRRLQRRRQKMNRSSSHRRPSLDLASTIFQNPYQSVRGRSSGPQRHHSMKAIRSFIQLVPVQDNDDDGNDDQEEQQLLDDDDHDIGLDLHKTQTTAQQEQEILAMPSLHVPLETVPEQLQDSAESDWATPTAFPQRFESTHVPRTDLTAETAAHLAEGTVRAWRDLCLEEAVELNAALRFWSDRWEQPGLSLLEAGPTVWFQRSHYGGYRHRLVGQRVAQIQAVLARRCAAIGELQLHLLQAGWQKGVAQWGVLGQGGANWATVAGFDGSLPTTMTTTPTTTTIANEPSPVDVEASLAPEHNRSMVQDVEQEQDSNEEQEPTSPAQEPAVPNLQHLPSASRLTRQMSDQGVRFSSVMAPEEMPPPPSQYPSHASSHSLGEPPGSVKDDSDDSRIGGGQASSFQGEPQAQQKRSSAAADVFVRKRDGGGTFVDDPAFLARWSVEAIALVRRQLFRASNGTVSLPFASHWTHVTQQPRGVTQNEETEVEDDEDEDNLILGPAQTTMLPLWALDGGQPRYTVADPSNQEEEPAPPQVMIADLSALTNEVSELLNCMEHIMDIQRERRLDRFQPPNWWRRNWYLLSVGVPLGIWLVRHGRLRYLIRYLARNVKFFFVERIQTPVMAIFDELWKGRQSFSDKKARLEAIDVLKKMIKSWLDDSYPNMAAAERQRMADNMDVSLVEKKKEESMKTLGFNTFDVVRMSFIEMQWLKKEMMAALDAMDEVMSANDINMNLAAVTPVVLILYVQNWIMRYLFYALLRIGRSREEVYASFRAILLDIERLLVMRDNPPDTRAANAVPSTPPSVLGPDDLGMLMLLIHECRTILWRDRRRFSAKMTRSVSEDLAELAGERGAVSVKQQLQIVARMTRSYPFLKVISTGHFFGQNQLRRD